MKAKLKSYDMVTGRAVFLIEAPTESDLSVLHRPEIYQGCSLSIRYSRSAHTVGLERQRARWFSILTQILKYHGVFDEEALLSFHNQLKQQYFGQRHVGVGDNSIALTPSINEIEPMAIKQACDEIEREYSEQGVVFYNRMLS